MRHDLTSLKIFVAVAECGNLTRAAEREHLAVSRAAINLGNPILAHRDAQSGEPGGVSVDLAREFARRLGAELELVVFDAAGKSVEAVTQEQADIGFFAVDPLRGVGIAFTAPYVPIEGCCLVPEASPIRSNDEVDRAGRTVVAGKGSAYDLYLTRELKHATILRPPTSPTVVDTFVAQRADVAAGVKQQLESDARRLGGLRLLDGRFMVIQQVRSDAKRAMPIMPPASAAAHHRAAARGPAPPACPGSPAAVRASARAR